MVKIKFAAAHSTFVTGSILLVGIAAAAVAIDSSAFGVAPAGAAVIGTESTLSLAFQCQASFMQLQLIADSK